MLKYKIKDLLLIYKDRDCKFAVLNNDKTKIKIITKNEILPLTNPLDIYVDFANQGGFYAYQAADKIYALPVVIKGYQANKVLLNNNEPKKFDNIEEFNQLSSIVLLNNMYWSIPILSATFGINEDDCEFENENRNKFIDIPTIEKIENAINVAETKNDYNIKKYEMLVKQRQQNQEDEKTYSQALEF